MVVLQSEATGGQSSSTHPPSNSSDSSQLSVVDSDQTNCDNVISLDKHQAPVSIKMELTPSVFDARHTDNTEVLLALLTQNKDLEGELSLQV